MAKKKSQKKTNKTKIPKAGSINKDDLDKAKKDGEITKPLFDDEDSDPSNNEVSSTENKDSEDQSSAEDDSIEEQDENEENTDTIESEGSGSSPEDDSPELPEVKEEDEEKPNKKAVPKINKPSEETKRQHINIDVSKEDKARAKNLVNDTKRQLNANEAVAYAMTQENPVSAVKRLVRQRRVTSPTDTYKAMEEVGYKISK